MVTVRDPVRRALWHSPWLAVFTSRIVMVHRGVEFTPPPLALPPSFPSAQPPLPQTSLLPPTSRPALPRLRHPSPLPGPPPPPKPSPTPPPPLPGFSPPLLTQLLLPLMTPPSLLHTAAAHASSLIPRTPPPLPPPSARWTGLTSVIGLPRPIPWLAFSPAPRDSGLRPHLVMLLPQPISSRNSILTRFCIMRQSF